MTKAKIKGFLEIIKREKGGSDYAGDQFGGASGTDGSGLPDSDVGDFLFATGIECSYPTIKGRGRSGRVRRDLLKECGHYTHWKQDFQLVKELVSKCSAVSTTGASRMRSCEMQRLVIVSILDLLHFGVPELCRYRRSRP